MAASRLVKMKATLYQCVSYYVYGQPITTQRSHTGRRGKTHTFLILALDIDEWLSSRSGRFTF